MSEMTSNVHPTLSKAGGGSRRRLSAVILDKDSKSAIVKSLKQMHEKQLPNMEGENTISDTSSAIHSIHREGHHKHPDNLQVTFNSTHVSNSSSSHRHHRPHTHPNRMHQAMVIMRMMSNFEKQVTASRLAVMASGFYQWKHSTMPHVEKASEKPITSAAVPSRRFSSYITSNASPSMKMSSPIQDTLSLPSSSGMSSSSSMSLLFPSNNTNDGYQKKYLALFAENEQLRAQIQVMKKTSSQKSETLRKKGHALLVKIFLRYHINTRLRHSFDIWYLTTQSMTTDAAVRRNAIQLEIGLKQVDTELAARVHLEEECKLLRRELAISVSFFIWKINKCQFLLNEERDKMAAHRKEMFVAVRMMKEYIKRSTLYDSSAATAVLEQEANVKAMLISLASLLRDKIKEVK